MVFFHLADLHIGKRVHGFSLLEDQRHIFMQILDHIDREKPDAVLICGDVYDSSQPGAEAVRLLDDFLFALTQREVQVIIISGNHDSPERLAFGSRLLAKNQVHLSPVYQGQAHSLRLTDAHGPVNFYLLPFIKPAQVRKFLNLPDVSSYSEAVTCAVSAMQINPEERNVLLAHQFVTGSQRSDSEEISVGGSDNVDAAAFLGFDYVALGHLHRPQQAGGNHLRYAGSPLKYSLSEVDHSKGITKVNLGKKGQLSIDVLPLRPRRDLREIRGSFERLLEPTFYSAQQQEDYLHLILTDEEEIPGAMGRLRQIYPHVMHLSYDNQRSRERQQLHLQEDPGLLSPLALFEALYSLQNNQQMSQQQRDFAQQLLQDLKEDGA